LKGHLHVEVMCTIAHLDQNAHQQTPLKAKTTQVDHYGDKERISLS